MKRKRKPPSVPPPIIHALGAFIGSATSFLLFYPLERLRIELQQKQQKDRSKNTNQRANCNKQALANNETLYQTLLKLYIKKQLYKGASSFTISYALSNFIFFYANELMKSMLIPVTENRKDSSMKKRLFLASILAAIVNVLLTNPLWVANMRIIQKSKENNNSISLLSQLYEIIQQEKSISPLWNGTKTSLMLVLNPVIQQFCYGILRQKLLFMHSKDNSQFLTPMKAFVCGAISKAIATLLTYPLQLAQVLQRSSDQYLNTMDCLVQVIRAGGAAALYQGIQAKLWQTVLTSAFTFCTYEQIMDILMRSVRK